ncbi:60Kd inner membrane protein-domain-containing protein [Phaeosphaeriaceae sp. PMI808]|nr:60Kd inner membrane protein-domain-containing protein [Phaeosphaeriaceae sp. PMI808]
MLSSRLIRRPASQLLSSRFVVSPVLLCRPSVRSFHVSAPRQDPLLDSILYLPHEMMNLVHTNVPWYAAIPFTAFIIRGALVTTAGSWARSLMARYLGLQPLRQALAYNKREEILRQGNFRNPREAEARVKKDVKEEMGKLDKRWNVTIKGQIGWTFAQLPIFIAMADTIRQKCAARDGLLGMALSILKGEEIPTGATDVATTASKWFEPSLANEGILWFPDLLLPDPTGALPFLVSGLMFTNIYMTKNTVESASKVPRRIKFVLLGVSLMIGPLCQKLPAALMLYWASSTCSVIIWNAWLDWKYPAPRGFTACARPLQMPPIPARKGRKV